jgi:hypothetical protein
MPSPDPAAVKEHEVLMAKLIYRVIAPNSNLGYGFPPDSFATAIQGRVDAIVCDAGTALDGPSHLGEGTEYFTRQQVKADVLRIVDAANRIGCPVIIGSAGTAGSDRHICSTQSIFAEAFEALGIASAQVATISAEVPAVRMLTEIDQGTLSPLGQGIALRRDSIRDSFIVGQMGVHPIISALDGGAQYVIAGRACDASLFAADMIRRGISTGLAYHAGQILDCGALACEPGSVADCLVCEIYDDGIAYFLAPNVERRCTVHSIAAHSLYNVAHPHIQVYPEGVLDTSSSQYHARDARVAGISGARFTPGTCPISVKLEGSRKVGSRKYSLLHIDASDIDKIPDDLIVYGRNGVQMISKPDRSRENGIIIETTAVTPDSAMFLAVTLADHLRRFPYPGRKGCTGNIAHPLSPHTLRAQRAAGQFGALIIGGTADPEFFRLLRRIESAVIEQIEAATPQAFAYATHTLTLLSPSDPAVLVMTIDADPERLEKRHQADVARVTSVAAIKPASLLSLDASDAYEWSLFHVLRNEQLIRDEFFLITHYEARGRTWTLKERCRPVYTDISESGRSEEDPLTKSIIDDAAPRGITLGSQRLIDMAAVIRSTNSGVNRMSFDIFFISASAYEAALGSNVFFRDNIARALGLESDRILGTYFADSSNAIKITIERPVAGGMHERDLYGEQQQGVLEDIQIPIYASVRTTSG